MTNARGQSKSISETSPIQSRAAILGHAGNQAKGPAGQDIERRWLESRRGKLVCRAWSAGNTVQSPGDKPSTRTTRVHAPPPMHLE